MQNCSKLLRSKVSNLHRQKTPFARFTLHVDTQLCPSKRSPDFLPVDVQHSYEGLGLLPLCTQGRVEPLDRPGEQLPVDVFGQCVSGLQRLLTGKWFDQHLAAHDQPAMTQPVGHLRPLHPQQLGEDGQGAVVCLQGNNNNLGMILEEMFGRRTEE